MQNAFRVGKVICLFCSKEFLKRKKITKFCSRSCGIKYRGKFNSKKTKAVCFICKKEWLDYPFNNKRVPKRFCSKNCFKEYKKTLTIWNKGKKLPPLSTETRKKQSISHLKIREKSHFWKGGITPINKQIRNSQEYRLWRESIFKRDNWTCIWCRKRGGRLNADHIKPFAYFPELRFAIDNGRTLCEECHHKTNTYGRLANKWKLI